MLNFDFSEADKKKYCKMAKERLDEAGITFLQPDYGAIGARGWDCTTRKADVVIVHLTAYPKSRWSRKKESECRKIKGWRITEDARGSKWRRHNMSPEVPDTMVRSRIEFTDGRGRHGKG